MTIKIIYFNRVAPKWNGCLKSFLKHGEDTGTCISAFSVFVTVLISNLRTSAPQVCVWRLVDANYVAAGYNWYWGLRLLRLKSAVHYFIITLQPQDQPAHDSIDSIATAITHHLNVINESHHTAPHTALPPAVYCHWSPVNSTVKGTL